MSLLGRERRVEFLAQSTMGATEMIISKRQRQLIFQIDPLLRKSVHLAPQSSGMLSNGQMVALDAIGVDHVTHGRCSQKGLQLLLSAIHQAGRDTDKMWPVAFFDDHRVTQVGRRPLPRKWKTSARASLVKNGKCESCLDFRVLMNCLASASVRLPTRQVGTSLYTGSNATQIQASP